MPQPIPWIVRPLVLMTALSLAACGGARDSSPTHPAPLSDPPPGYEREPGADLDPNSGHEPRDEHGDDDDD